MFIQVTVGNTLSRTIGTLLLFAAMMFACCPTFAIAIEREIAWTEDYEGAIQRAAANNTLILLHFYGDYCPPCKLLDKKTFHDPALVSSMNQHLVAIKINADRRRDLAQKYQVTRWPTDVYLYPNGDEIYRGVSNADPAVYCKTIERVALRHRDWTVERNSMAKAKERRQDKAIAAHTPQIKTEPHINSAGSGRSVKTQEAAFTNPTDRTDLPKVLQSNERPLARSTSRIIDNPYLADAPLVVPPAVVSQPKPSAVATPIAATPNIAGPQPTAVAQPPAPQIHAAPIVNTAISRPAEIVPAVPTPSSMLREPQTVPSLTNPSMPTPSTKQVEAKPVSSPRESNLRNTSSQPESANASVGSNQPPTAANRQVYAETIGLGGFCPVTLIESLTNPEIKGWVEGKKSCAVRHRGRVYHCASERARQTLLSDPDKYTPCLSGFDIVTLCNEGLLHDGKCEYGCIQEGTNRVFLFENKANYDAFAQNTAYYSRLLDNSAPERVATELNGTQIR